MDHKEEQASEVEALESIYCGEMEVLATEPFHVFSVPIKSDDYEEEVEGIRCLLKFEYTPHYPEQVPLISVEDLENIEAHDGEALRLYLAEQAEENVGMVMVFTLVSAAQEWVNVKSDKLKKEKEEDEERRKKEQEEAERKRFEGTHVTVESFLTWKRAFDLDMGILKKREKEEKNKKPTGRELFMLDKSLNESDLKFLEEGGDFVKVDESLFQELDDLDLDDEIDLSNDERES